MEVSSQIGRRRCCVRKLNALRRPECARDPPLPSVMARLRLWQHECVRSSPTEMCVGHCHLDRSLC
jgi:hypothetical protein